MGGESYAAAGGSLKLKGVVGSKIEKKKKKKRKVPDEVLEKSETEAIPTATSPGEQDVRRSRSKSPGDDAEKDAVAVAVAVSEADLGKTEAERRHDEMRRQRVCLAVIIIHV